jgi:hypothetical protein
VIVRIRRQSRALLSAELVLASFVVHRTVDRAKVLLCTILLARLRVDTAAIIRWSGIGLHAGRKACLERDAIRHRKALIGGTATAGLQATRTGLIRWWCGQRTRAARIDDCAIGKDVSVGVHTAVANEVSGVAPSPKMFDTGAGSDGHPISRTMLTPAAKRLAMKTLRFTENPRNRRSVANRATSVLAVCSTSGSASSRPAKSGERLVKHWSTRRRPRPLRT